MLLFAFWDFFHFLYHYNCLLCGLQHCWFVVLSLFQIVVCFFQNILSGISAEFQTVWISIIPDGLSGLIWVQTVCKSYQQMTLIGKELKETACNAIVEYKKTCSHGKTNEPRHEISNNVVCATSKCSDQPAHLCSLIRTFARRLAILRVLSY